MEGVEGQFTSLTSTGRVLKAPVGNKNFYRVSVGLELLPISLPCVYNVLEGVIRLHREAWSLLMGLEVSYKGEEPV